MVETDYMNDFTESDPLESSKKVRILKEAAQLFAAHGYAGASIRQIATAADVNVSMIAYYFQGKEGLYRSVVEYHIDLFAAELTKKLTAVSTFEGRLRLFVEQLMDSLLVESDILKIVIRELLNEDSEALMHLSGMIPGFTKIFDLLYEGVDDRAAQPIEPTAFVFEIFMGLAPVYFYFLVRPIVDNFILENTGQRDQFRVKLSEDIYQRLKLLADQNIKTPAADSGQPLR